MKRKYFVYAIVNRELDLNQLKVFEIPDNCSPFGYNTKDEAIQWIEESGVQNCSYVIIKKYKKI